MTSGLKALTARGRSFLASGIAALLCAFILGEHDLLRIGVLILSLPLLAALVVARTRYRLSCARRLDPPRAELGSEATVTLRLENVTRLPTGLLMIEDTVPYALGARPRFVLDRVESQGVREIDYRVRSDSLTDRLPEQARELLGELAIDTRDLSALWVHGTLQAMELSVAPGLLAQPGAPGGRVNEREKLRDLGRRVRERILR